jgi:hypothetical protein
MTSFRRVSAVLALCAASATASANFDGTAPLECAARYGHDCLASEDQCNRLMPESNRAPLFLIDFAKQEIQSPFRTSVLRMLNVTSNREALVLQGSDLLFAWSALINRKSGAMTISIADRQGAYVVFGQCKMAQAQ